MNSTLSQITNENNNKINYFKLLVKKNIINLSCDIVEDKIQPIFEVQVLIDIYKNKIKKLMYHFINTHLPYYYETYRDVNNYKLYDSYLDYEIRNCKAVNIFYFGRFSEWNDIRWYMFNNAYIFYKHYNIEPDIKNFHKLDIDMCKTINKIEGIINKFSDTMGKYDSNDDMVNNLSKLDVMKVDYRDNLEYTLSNELEEKTFKIFKKPVGDRLPAINPKPYYQMKEFIKEYVLRKKTELENIIEEI